MLKWKIRNKKTKEVLELWSLDAREWLADESLGYERVIDSSPEIKKEIKEVKVNQDSVIEESEIRKKGKSLKIRGYASMDLETLKEKISNAETTS